MWLHWPLALLWQSPAVILTLLVMIATARKISDFGKSILVMAISLHIASTVTRRPPSSFLTMDLTGLLGQPTSMETPQHVSAQIPDHYPDCLPDLHQRLRECPLCGLDALLDENNRFMTHRSELVSTELCKLSGELCRSQAQNPSIALRGTLARGAHEPLADINSGLYHCQ
jgi:hypothetical protein